MLKYLHDRYLEFSELLDIIDWIGKHFLIEKKTFRSMSNIYFHDAQIFGTAFSLSVPTEILWLL